MIHTSAYKEIEPFRNLEHAKRKAHLIKWKLIENLDKVLPEFENQFTRRGGKVVWANDLGEIEEALEQILQKHALTHVQVQPSPITQEVGLDAFLEKTKLRPSTWENVRDQDSADAVAGTLGISGVDFAVVEAGALAYSLISPELHRITSGCGVQVALVGIEQLVPSLKDVELFWTLLHTHKYGQTQPVPEYARLLFGPKQAGEWDGPNEFYVIFVDNGRSNLLTKPEQRQGLYCIGCEACLNVCPVFQVSGGTVQGRAYQGPIHSLIAPHTRGTAEFQVLSLASTLCGKCSEICPVRIDIRRMLLLNRRDAVQAGKEKRSERIYWKIFRWFSASRKRFDFWKPGLKNMAYKWLYGRKEGKFKELPRFASSSFSAQFQAEAKNSDLPQSQFLSVKSRR